MTGQACQNPRRSISWGYKGEFFYMLDVMRKVEQKLVINSGGWWDSNPRLKIHAPSTTFAQKVNKLFVGSTICTNKVNQNAYPNYDF